MCIRDRADTVAKAPADGYTLLVSTTGIESVNPFLFAKMPYDPGKDLALSLIHI